MSNPYIPPSDSGFDAWAVNFSGLLTASPTTYGLIAGDAVIVAGVVATWSAAYADAINPSTRTPVTIAAKDSARTAAVATMRPYAQQISKDVAVANGDKTAIGVPLINTARTPVPPPTTQPALSLIAVVHNLITLAYRDTSTPTSKAKPPGAVGLDLRVFIGTTTPPAPDAMVPYGTVTKSPVAIATDNADIGKTATFYGRWVTRSGPGGQAQVGPWSAPLSLSVS